MMTKRPQDRELKAAASATDADARLEGFFTAAREATDDRLPDALQARLLGDALARMAPRAPLPAPLPAPPRPRAGLWQRLAGWSAGIGRAVGGLPGLAVVSAAGLVGVWIGVAVPEPATDLIGHVWQGAVVAGPLGGDRIEVALGLSDDGALLALMDSF